MRSMQERMAAINNYIDQKSEADQRRKLAAKKDKQEALELWKAQKDNIKEFFTLVRKCKEADIWLGGFRVNGSTLEKNWLVKSLKNDTRAEFGLTDNFAGFEYHGCHDIVITENHINFPEDDNNVGLKYSVEAALHALNICEDVFYEWFDEQFGEYKKAAAEQTKTASEYDADTQKELDWFRTLLNDPDASNERVENIRLYYKKKHPSLGVLQLADTPENKALVQQVDGIINSRKERKQ